jgi:ATP-dependent Clp protease adaptor protein ClpS
MKLWRLIQRLFAPRSGDAQDGTTFSGSNLQAAVDQPFLQGIELQNDDITPMEFVVDVLMRHVALSNREAILTMLKIHSEGSARVALESERQAHEAAKAIRLEAEAKKYPLVCRPIVGNTESGATSA